jgi:mono/diheme cytochrome c family protein
MLIRKHASLYAAFATCAVCATPTATAQDTEVLEHMHAHSDAVMAIRQSVIAGSPGGVKESARWLLEHEPPASVAAGWADYLPAMRAAAKEALDASDLTAAAAATSRLGLACGGCHAASNAVFESTDTSRPSMDEDTGSHMLRHQWAADKMWEGLIWPKSYSWQSGANLLFESAIKPHELGDQSGNAELQTMARRIHQLAANATMVQKAEERAEIYAEFLANCGGCHEALQARPAE